MIEKFYMYLGALNQQPDVLLNVREEQRQNVIKALQNIRIASSTPEGDLDSAVMSFVQICDLAELSNLLKIAPKRMRGYDLGPEGKPYPRELINTITIKTEKSLLDIVRKYKQRVERAGR